MIARLKKERDEARSLLAQAERQAPLPALAATANVSALSNGKRGSFSVYCSLMLYIFS